MRNVLTLSLALLVAGACQKGASAPADEAKGARAPTAPTSTTTTTEPILMKPASGPWRATVLSKGGELPFTLELNEEGADAYSAVIVNGDERLEVPDVTLAGDVLTFVLPLYDSRIVASVQGNGERLEGSWTRTRKNGPATLRFAADAGERPRFAVPPKKEAAAKDVSGRWSVQFASQDTPAVAVFERGDNGLVGTVLTATGDYRYLAGAQHGDDVMLSTFDGASAYLLRANLSSDGDELYGKVFAGDHGQDSWTAKRDDGATLPNGFQLSRWTGERPLAELKFKDLDGREVSLGDPKLKGKARIIEVFGTWCPNCHDATRYLVELHGRYRDQGLVIVGLAFEHTGDFARDAAEVRRWREHHGVEYPLLLAGTTGEGGPEDKLPLDELKAYPTTLFVDRNDQVVAVHAGFSGPATGAAYDALQEEYEERVRSLLQ